MRIAPAASPALTSGPTVTELPREDDAAPGIDRHVDVRYTVTEGPRTLVGSIGFAGNTVLAESPLRALMTTAPGRPYSEGEVAVDRDRIDLEYRNRGYESVVVNPVITLADNGTRADVRFEISEGPQVLVDHVIIIGNQRTSTQTIEREVLLKPESRWVLGAHRNASSVWPLLVFFAASPWTNCAIAARHGATCSIQVEEAPPTTIGYGGGVEGGTRLRPTGDSGQAEERFEVAPRGFVEISRRNLWGKNRAVTLFTRVSLRSRDIVLSGDGIRLEQPAGEQRTGSTSIAWSAPSANRACSTRRPTAW